MTGAEHTSDSDPARPAIARAGEPAVTYGSLPYRGRYGEARPHQLADLPLPPGPMPLVRHGRPLKRWRYVGFFCSELIACVAIARIGPARDEFWAVWDRRRQRFHRGGGPLQRGIVLADGLARVRSRHVSLELTFTEDPGIESVTMTGAAHAWTRKQSAANARAWLSSAAGTARLTGSVLVDDTAAYYERHTHWRWSAGAGRAVDGRHVAWSLVDGVGDPPERSERTIWVDGVPSEPPPSRFAADLAAVDDLSFTPEAVLARTTNLGLVRSRYRQPMGSFQGRLLADIEVADAHGVMEDHDAWW